MSSGTSAAEVPNNTIRKTSHASCGGEGGADEYPPEPDNPRKNSNASSGLDSETGRILSTLGNVKESSNSSDMGSRLDIHSSKNSNASSGLDSETERIVSTLGKVKKSSISSDTERPTDVNLRKDSMASFGMDSETGRLLSSLGNPRKTSNASSDMERPLEVNPRKDSIVSFGIDSETGRILSSLENPRKTSNASSGMEAELEKIHKVHTRPRKDSIASLGMDSVTGGLAELPEPIIDLPAHDHDESADDNQFQVPASVPQHHLKLPAYDTSLHVSFVHFNNPLEESVSLTGSKGSRNLPERRLPTKKRKMSYESYDSAMGDSYLGLASLDSGILPKLHPDGASVNTKGSGASSNVQLSGLKVSALDHLDALGDDRGDEKLPPPAPRKRAEAEAKEEPGADDNNSEETFTSSGHRLLMEAIMMTTGGAGGLDRQGRKRLESWGGMSDLSVHMGPDHGDTAAVIAASALHHTGIFEDVTAAAGLGGSVASSVTDDHPGRSELLHHGRERKGSTTSYSDSTFPVPSSLEGLELSSDLQQFVAAAVASVGDQLAELAGNIESAAAAVDLDGIESKDYLAGRGSETSSIATPAGVGALLDDPSHITVSGQSSAHIDASSASMDVKAAAASAAAISVDYDAVAAAVDAAHAATGGLDLSAIMGDGTTSHHSSANFSTASSVSSGGVKSSRKRKLPTSKTHVSILRDVPISSLSAKEQEEIRERARKAAGYVPPSHLPDGGAVTPAKNRALPPLKKRMKRATPEPATSKSNTMATPKISNITSKPIEKPANEGKAKASSSATKGKEKSTQKWDSMFESLIQFVEERKAEETIGMSDEELADWTWDGNVPTTYKTKDGKALGRWINNQRSAKSKGTLREERENRLVGAGLKWSVLASNSWNEMLDELRIYIKEYTKDGRKWDGNVPTNYRIKARPNGKKLTEEDKNLGRWVNRQRSLYQAGKLREDRQKVCYADLLDFFKGRALTMRLKQALEKVGLKWSMLATTSWDAMFETLEAYVEDRTRNGTSWDGNVPANYRTDDTPPRALGRWINRQRSAHVKKKLKKEYVDKLSELGLKWSVHERKYNEDLPETTPAKPRADSESGQVPATSAVPANTIERSQAPPATEIDSAKPTSVPSGRFDDNASQQLHSMNGAARKKGGATQGKPNDNAESIPTDSEPATAKSAAPVLNETSGSNVSIPEAKTNQHKLDSPKPGFSDTATTTSVVENNEGQNHVMKATAVIAQPETEANHAEIAIAAHIQDSEPDLHESKAGTVALSPSLATAQVVATARSTLETQPATAAIADAVPHNAPHQPVKRLSNHAAGPKSPETADGTGVLVDLNAVPMSTGTSANTAANVKPSEPPKPPEAHEHVKGEQEPLDLNPLLPSTSTCLAVEPAVTVEGSETNHLIGNTEVSTAALINAASVDKDESSKGQEEPEDNQQADQGTAEPALPTSTSMAPPAGEGCQESKTDEKPCPSDVPLPKKENGGGATIEKKACDQSHTANGEPQSLPEDVEGVTPSDPTTESKQNVDSLQSTGVTPAEQTKDANNAAALPERCTRG